MAAAGAAGGAIPLGAEGGAAAAELWKWILEAIGKRFGPRVAGLLGAAAVDGPLPIGDIIAVLGGICIAGEIIYYWDDIVNQAKALMAFAMTAGAGGGSESGSGAEGGTAAGGGAGATPPEGPSKEDLKRELGNTKRSIEKWLKKNGWEKVKGGKGSHAKWKGPNGETTIVPDSPKVGTINNIINTILGR